MFGWFKKKKKKEVEKTVEKQPVQPKVEEKPVVEVAPEAQEAPEKPTVEEAPFEETIEEAPKKERKMPYHITKHPKGGWQIKKGKADRALKRFDTQKEAIEYADELEKERGISYVIHKADGSVRKKKY